MVDLNDVTITVWPERQKGQQCGYSSNGVKIVHKTLGIEAVCNASRSQLKNKEIAMDMILSAITHELMS